MELGNLREDSQVTVEAGDIADWAFVRGEQPTGLFSIKAIQAIQTERNGVEPGTESAPGR